MEHCDIEEVAYKTFNSTHIVGLDNQELVIKGIELRETDVFQQWCQMLQASQDNLRLAIGAVIADRMRMAVKERTGFSCSAGIGHNKVSYLLF